MIEAMSTDHTEFMITIGPGAMATMGRWEAAVIGLVQAPSAAGVVRPISAPATRSERLERLIGSA